MSYDSSKIGLMVFDLRYKLVMLLKMYDLNEAVQLMICFFLMGAATWAVVGVSAQTPSDLTVSTAINSSNIQRNADDIKGVENKQEAMQHEIELLKAENLAIKEMGGLGMTILAALKLIGLRINWSAVAAKPKDNEEQ